jgi:hypothetical protein
MTAHREKIRPMRPVERPSACRPRVTSSCVPLDSAPVITSEPAAAATGALGRVSSPHAIVGRRSQAPSRRGSDGRKFGARVTGTVDPANASERERTASGTQTAIAPATDSANGRPAPARWATSPARPGPTSVPIDDHTIAPPVPPEASSCASATFSSAGIRDSHATPAVHSTPNATPNRTRPQTSAVSDGSACRTPAIASSSPEASVTRRGPKRSARTPAGTETSSIVSPGRASTSALSDADR